jgi:HTH-type transcriptional regulator / antitoxin HigA
LELITAFPPRPIDNERSYAATQTQINKILDKPELNPDDLSEKAKCLRAYLKILGLTIYDYEEQTESF